MLVSREDAVRAFIEHRGRYGFLRLTPRFTLYLNIEFSNEERAIVKTRALQNYIFDLSPGFLGASESRYSAGTLAMTEAGGLALFVIGVLGFFAAAAVSALGPVTLLCIVAGVILFWCALSAKRREQSANLKELTLGYLLANPSISIQAINPGQAPLLEDNVRLRLIKLKHFLTQTNELTTPRWFET
jgi:hypothetical protein